MDVPLSTELFQQPSHPDYEPQHNVLPNHVWLSDDPLVPLELALPPAKPLLPQPACHGPVIASILAPAA